MKNTWKIFRYEVQRNAKRKGYLFTTFGLPILAIVVSLVIQFIGDQNARQAAEQAAQEAEQAATNPDAPQTGGGSPFSFEGIEQAGYVDSSGLFSDAPAMDAILAFPDEASAEAALAAGEIDALYIIPPDYATTGQVTVVVEEITLNNISSAPITELLFSELSNTLPPLTLVRLRDPANINTINLQRVPTNENAVNNEDSNFALVYGFGILFLVTVFGTSGYLMQSVIEEKENRLVEILLSSVRPAQLLAGKVLALGLLGIGQLVAWFAISYAFLTIQASRGIPNPLASLYIPPEMLPILVIYFLLGYLMFAAAFGGVGALSNSISEGPQLSFVFGIPVFITFYLFPLFINSPNGALPTFLSLFPLSSPLAMVMRSVVAPVPAWQIALSLGLLLLGVIGMFWVAGKMFSVQTLLSGKVPKLRELPKLIFG
jgi:ABC-2 type transport system permease protein